MNRAARRKAQAEGRSKPTDLACSDCNGSEFVYHSEPLGNDTPILCDGCGRRFGTYAAILGSMRYSQKPGGSLDGRKRVVFLPKFKMQS